MKLTFLGATQTVSGSKYLIDNTSERILVDCGLFQGLKELRLRNWNPFPIDVKTINAVVLTHAHVDHSGYLPLLSRLGYKGPIYCTHATRDLCRILLPDTAWLQEEEAEYANRKGFSKHHPAMPLFTQDDAFNCLDLMVPMDFKKEFQLTPQFKCQLIPAGHILGASIVKIIGKRTLVFSGDLGRPNDPIMKAPEFVDRTDYLVVESTYGSRVHDPRDPLDVLEDIIKRTFSRGGVILVPAFTVGRSQLLLHMVYELKKQKRVRSFPVYLNSPMAISATQIFCDYHHLHRLSMHDVQQTCAVATYVHDPEASKGLNQKQGPMMIIAGSGMATGGRILHHLKAFAPDPKNTILLTGYQAEGTRGAQLMSGAKTVKIHGEQIPVNAEIASIDNLSAHADSVEIMEWLSHFQSSPRCAFITHGAMESAQTLSETIRSKLQWKTHIPTHLEKVDLP